MDLSEAIQYFQAGTDDPPLSSTSSILSGRSFGSKKITLRVHISVDYDGPSLSDTSSIASLDDYRSRNGSEASFSFGTPSVIEPDDDSVTVSSKDTGGLRSRASGSQLQVPDQRSQLSGESSWGAIPSPSRSSRSPRGPRSTRTTASTSKDPFADEARYPTDPSAVFERLKLQEAYGDDSSSVADSYDPVSTNDRGALWLQDQKDRAVYAKLGVLPEPSEPDSVSLSYTEGQDLVPVDLALEKTDRGNYYYLYNGASSSGASQNLEQESIFGESSYDSAASIDGVGMSNPRPTSRHLTWLAAHQVTTEGRSSSSAVAPPAPLRTHHSDPSSANHIPPELYAFIPITPPVLVTTCSECGTALDSIRYVCSTCGEKDPAGEPNDLHLPLNGKGKERSSIDNLLSYPPPPHHSSRTLTTQTYVGSSADSLSNHKLLSSLPNVFGSETQSSSTVHLSPRLLQRGFELCSGCIESAGLTHAIEAGVAPGSSPTASSMSPTSPQGAQLASQWRRLAPKEKGKLRHAYHEMIWGHEGWKDIEQDEASSVSCSACGAVTALGKSYKCASCKKYYLCKACYSLVHNVHPSHAFLLVPGKQLDASKSEPDFFPASFPPDPSDEEFMKHPGVKCAHCLQDIVGARFHCAICDAIDICANCESAGLPGNLDSADGGHTSSHILIKIPYPLETTELEQASRRAIHLWTGRDAAHVGRPPSPTKSAISGYANTVIGPLRGGKQDEHDIACNGCAQSIAGIRYQCGNCPSLPTSFNLCTHCEARSYMLHDPTHVFFKLPRPVDRPIESRSPLLPKLYKHPVGPSSDTNFSDDPRAYLRNVTHTTALCDLCMTVIQGAWFRCVYCGKDLCDACEELDNHNSKHFFMVFKAPVDMHAVKVFTNFENPNQSPPVIKHPVYM